MPSVLITGANRGLGLEFARQYAADGWQVYASYRDLSSASKLRRLANTSEDNVRIMALDVTDPSSVKAAVTKLEGQAIDLLLNNAGVGGARDQIIGNINYAAWEKVRSQAGTAARKESRWARPSCQADSPFAAAASPPPRPKASRFVNHALPPSGIF